MDSVVHRHRHVRIRCITPVALAVAMLTLAACRQPAAESPPDKRKPQQAGQPVSAVDMARHVAAARVAAATGNSRQAEQHIKAMASDITRSARMADPMRPINPEAARAAARTIHGVRSAIWLDRANLVVIVAGAQYRSMDTIDEVCLPSNRSATRWPSSSTCRTSPPRRRMALTPCRATASLAKVNVLSMQQKRQVDVVSKELRETFKGMQGVERPKIWCACSEPMKIYPCCPRFFRFCR